MRKGRGAGLLLCLRRSQGGGRVSAAAGALLRSSQGRRKGPKSGVVLGVLPLSGPPVTILPRRAASLRACGPGLRPQGFQARQRAEEGTRHPSPDGQAPTCGTARATPPARSPAPTPQHIASRGPSLLRDVSH